MRRIGGPGGPRTRLPGTHVGRSSPAGSVHRAGARRAGRAEHAPRGCATMKRWLPFPVMSAVLLLTWLLVNQDVGLSQVLLGGCVAIAVPLLVRPLQPLAYPRLQRPLALMRL